MTFARQDWSKLASTLRVVTVVLCVMLLAIGSVLMRVWSYYRAPYSFFPPTESPDWIAGLHALRRVVWGGLVVAAAALLYVVLRWPRALAALRAVLQKEGYRYAVLTLLTVWGRSYLLLPGNMATGDAAVAVTNAWASRHWIEQGNWGIFWSNYAWLGSPYSQFHFSLYYYFVGLADFLFSDPYLTAKIVLLASHVAMTISMFSYVQALTRSGWSGLLSATLWSVTFYHYHIFPYLGLLVQSLSLFLMPLQLTLFERSVGRPFLDRGRAFLALAVALQLWTHQLSGGVSVGLLLVYIAVRTLAPWRRTALSDRVVDGLKALSWITLGAAIGAYQLIPVLLERDLVAVGGLFERASFTTPDLRLEHILWFDDSFLTPYWWGGYIGLVPLSVAALAVIWIICARRWRFLPLSLWFLASSYLALGRHYLPYDELFNNIPFGEWVYIIKAPGRYLIYVEFAVTALLGVALKPLVSVLRLTAGRLGRVRVLNHLSSASVSLILGSVLAGQMFYLSTQVNNLYPAEWQGGHPDRDGVMAFLRDAYPREGRVMDTLVGLEPGYDLAWKASLPGLSGHWEEAPASAWIVSVALDDLTSDLSAGAVAPGTVNELRMLNIGYVVASAAQSEGLSPPPGLELVFDDGHFRIFRVAAPLPAVASCAVRQVVAQEWPEILIPNARRNAVAYLPVNTATDETLRGCDTSTFEVMNHTVSPQYAALMTKSDSPLLAQLSYSYYPYLRVLVDGRDTDVFPTAFGLIGLSVPAGVHQIELIPALSNVRLVSLGVGALALLFVVAVVAVRS